MAYNPNEPRDAEGKWTAFDASNALYRAASDMPKTPLSEKEFYKKYKAQHKDLRSKSLAEAEATKKSILENGFNEGMNANAMPIYKGDTGTIISQRYGNKKGDIVYLLTKEGYIDGANGYKTKKGYKPLAHEIVIIKYDGQPTYEAYKEQFK